jgi:uncharacterized membrane protein YtjA (UPF0391 family)
MSVRRINAAAGERFHQPGSASPFGWNQHLPPSVFHGERGVKPHHFLRGALFMLGWALTFLIVALIAAVLGFGGIAGFAVEIAKIIFFVAIVLFVISAIVGLVRGRSPTAP